MYYFFGKNYIISINTIGEKVIHNDNAIPHFLHPRYLFSSTEEISSNTFYKYLLYFVHVVLFHSY